MSGHYPPLISPAGSVSRRQFLGMGAYSLALATVATASALTEPEATPRDGGSGPQRPVRVAERLTVPIHINGAGPYRFIVDTGADRTVLATEVGAELRLNRGPQVRLDGVVQTTIADTVSIDHLAFGSKTRGNFYVPTVSRSLLGADGYLGLDFLDGHRVTFDFERSLVDVGDSRPRFSAAWARPNEARIGTVGSSGHLRSLDCRVDGVLTSAFIDSGAEVSAANGPLLSALSRHNPRFGVIGDMQLIDITGGEIQGQVAMVKKIQLPGLTFDDCPLVIANFQVFKAWGLTHSPALLLGMNVLRQFSRVSVDYGLKELRFDLASLSIGGGFHDPIA
jgi:predicted aspartyl protease